jgi:hypothetical protein
MTLERPSLDALNGAIDEVRRRVGPSAMTRATLRCRDAGLAHGLFRDADAELRAVR